MLHGTVDVLSTISIGNMQIKGLLLNNKISLTGLNGFQGTTVYEMDITGGLGPTILSISALGRVPNPASQSGASTAVTMDMGRVKFDIMYQNTNCGFASHENLILNTGLNDVGFSGNYVENDPSCKPLLSGYINEIDSSIILKGNPEGVGDRWLAKAFETISLGAFFPHHPRPRMLIKVKPMQITY